MKRCNVCGRDREICECEVQHALDASEWLEHAAPKRKPYSKPVLTVYGDGAETDGLNLKTS